MGVQDRMGALIQVVLNAGFVCMQAGNTIFPMERPIFLREVNNGMYRVSSYYWSKLISDSPLLFTQIFIYNMMVYWLIGLNISSVEKPLIFFLAMLMEGYGFTALGYVVGAAISNL